MMLRIMSLSFSVNGIVGNIWLRKKAAYIGLHLLIFTPWLGALSWSSTPPVSKSRHTASLAPVKLVTPVHHARTLSCSYHFINAVKIFVQEREVTTSCGVVPDLLVSSSTNSAGWFRVLKMQADNSML